MYSLPFSLLKGKSYEFMHINALFIYFTFFLRLYIFAMKSNRYVLLQVFKLFEDGSISYATFCIFLV